jgi:uncharacterized Tic20 family protein
MDKDNESVMDQDSQQRAAGPRGMLPVESGPGLGDAPELTKDAKMWAMFCHLAGFARFVPVPFAGIIAPVIVWQVKKDEHPFVDYNGKQAVNFQISVAIYFLVAVLLCLVIVGFFLVTAVAIFNIVFLIIAAVKANNGEHYEYPLSIRFIN